MSRASLDYHFLYEYIQEILFLFGCLAKFFVIDCRLLNGKNVENQTLESLSSSVQKRFGKNDYLSGKFFLEIWTQFYVSPTKITSFFFT